MDFSWTDEQLEWKRSVIKFAQNELGKGLIERDQQAGFPRDECAAAPSLAS
jgi:hypothetical protein